MSNTPATTATGNGKTPGKKPAKVRGPNDPVALAFSLTPDEAKIVDNIAGALGGPGIRISRVQAARAAIIRFALTAEYNALVAKNVAPAKTATA